MLYSSDDNDIYVGPIYRISCMFRPISLFSFFIVGCEGLEVFTILTGLQSGYTISLSLWCTGALHQETVDIFRS